MEQDFGHCLPNGHVFCWPRGVTFNSVQMGYEGGEGEEEVDGC